MKCDKVHGWAVVYFPKYEPMETYGLFDTYEEAWDYVHKNALSYQMEAYTVTAIRKLPNEKND